MAVITPNSDIYLIKCPIELDNLNQLSFANATAQQTYFNALPKLELTGATFQRKDGTIRWPGSMESIMEYNYCMYRNKSHGNKWFYCFIDSMRYVSDSMTEIKISTDCWQTWQFDLEFKKSYVEREHVSDDTVGLHTIPEGLDTGEYVSNGFENVYYAKRSYWTTVPPATDGPVMVCIQLTTLTLKNSEGQTTQSAPTNPPTYSIINGVPMGTYIVGIPYNKSSMAGIYTLTGAYDSVGRGDAIVSIFLCPRYVCNWTQLQGDGIWGGGYFYKADDSDAAGAFNLVTVTKPTTINGYTPKNNKCFVGPYNYFHITNNCGTDIEFYYEDFLSNPTFTMVGSIEQGGSVSLVPNNSKKTANTQQSSSDGYTEGVVAARLPQLSWQSDYYLNWEAQNGKNIAIQTGLAAAGFALNTITGFAAPAAANASMRESAVSRGFFPDEEASPQVNAGGLLGGVINFASQVASTQNAIRQAKMVPPQAKGNLSGGYLQFADDHCCFTIFKMSCRAEYIKCIDDYFSMFGYKVNSLKIPNISGRANWNYVKTQGCNVIADIPQGDLQAIKAMFNNGITIWHNPTTFLDYSQNNNIV